MHTPSISLCRALLLNEALEEVKKGMAQRTNKGNTYTYKCIRTQPTPCAGRCC